MQGSPPRPPRSGAPAVPGQPQRHTAEGADERPAATPALPGPRPAPGAMPAQFLAGARAGLLRSRPPARPDTVVFTAACPACGQDCLWSEEREDTRITAAVDCPCTG